jgi:hypothetical protein
MLKAFLEMQTLKVKGLKKKRLERILSNPKGLPRLRSRITAKYPETKNMSDGEFLKFLMDHFDEILELILKVLDLLT